MPVGRDVHPEGLNARAPGEAIPARDDAVSINGVGASVSQPGRPETAGR
jgi:hypothetical protein